MRPAPPPTHGGHGVTETNETADKPVAEELPPAGVCIPGVYPRVNGVQIVLTPDDLGNSYILLNEITAPKPESCPRTDSTHLSLFFDNGCYKDVSEPGYDAWIKALLTRTCDFRSLIAQALARIQQDMSSPILHSTDLLSDIAYTQKYIEKMRLYIASDKQPELKQMLTKFANDAEVVLDREKTKLAGILLSGAAYTSEINRDGTWVREKLIDTTRLLNILGITGYTVTLTIEDNEGEIIVKKDS